jgi:hypothetical protein
MLSSDIPNTIQEMSGGLNYRNENEPVVVFQEAEKEMVKN